MKSKFPELETPLIEISFTPQEIRALLAAMDYYMENSGKGWVGKEIADIQKALKTPFENFVYQLAYQAGGNEIVEKMRELDK